MTKKSNYPIKSCKNDSDNKFEDCYELKKKIKRLNEYGIFEIIMHRARSQPMEIF